MSRLPFELRNLPSRSRRRLVGGVLFLILSVSLSSTARGQEGATPLEPELATLLASDPEAGDRFGYSVARSGDTVLIGASFGGPAGANTGAAYVYQRVPDTFDQWAEVKKLVPSLGGGEFGVSVAIDGDTALVGSRVSQSSGAVYVFGRNVGGPDNWGEVRRFTAADIAGQDQFGTAVALDGDTALIGSPQDDDAGTSSGSAYVFARNQGGADGWGQVRKLTASDAAESDSFGTSVALDGDTALVGASGNDDAGSSSGAAYVYSRNQGGTDVWGEIKKLTASDAGATHTFGRSVAVSLDTALVGANGATGSVASSGAVYAFERDLGGPNNWGESQKLINSDGISSSDFGWSLALEEDLAVIGAPGHNQTGAFSGVAYLFSRGSGTWAVQWKLVPTNLTTGDQYGLAVALDGSAAVVGGWAHDVSGTGDAGSAYVFRAPPLFEDGFESGDTSAWDLTVP